MCQVICYCFGSVFDTVAVVAHVPLGKLSALVISALCISSAVGVRPMLLVEYAIAGASPVVSRFLAFL